MKRSKPAVAKFPISSVGAPALTEASGIRYVVISSAVGLSAAAVYVKTMPCPVAPASVMRSTSTSGDSATVPLAV